MADSFEGKMLPDFQLESTEGRAVSKGDLAGSWTVLYFYPKDDTPGCTKEACAFTNNLAQFQALNARIYGVSMDNVESHNKFKSKYSLNFPLLADTEHKLADALGVYGDSSFMGKIIKMVSRDTFLVDPEGRIAKVWRKVNPTETVNIAYEELKARAGSS